MDDICCNKCGVVVGSGTILSGVAVCFTCAPKNLFKLTKEEIERLKENFVLFWKQYPKKQAKVKAREAYLKLRPNDDLHKKMMLALIRQTVAYQEDHEDETFKFFPNGASWISGSRWDDESYTLNVNKDGKVVSKAVPAPPAIPYRVQIWLAELEKYHSKCEERHDLFRDMAKKWPEDKLLRLIALIPSTDHPAILRMDIKQFRNYLADKCRLMEEHK